MFVLFFSTGLVLIDDINKTKMELQRAEKISAQLFEAVEKNNLMVPGKSEKQLNEEISKLALRKFGIEKYWHKKIVRCGRNTMSIYNDNPRSEERRVGK